MDKDKYAKLYEDTLKKRQERVEFLAHIAPKKVNNLGEVNAAELIGLFLVYEQLLEENIKILLNVVFEYKAAAVSGKFTVIRQSDFKGHTLGKLEGELNKILFHETVASQKQVDLLETLKKKLRMFVEKRNDYIHRLLKQNLKLDKFKINLINAIMELSELIDACNVVRAKIEKHYDFDGKSVLSIAGHMISKDATKKG